MATVAKKLEFRVSLKNYLIASVANRVRDKYRKKTHNTFGLENAEQIISNSNSPEQFAIYGEQLQFLMNSLYNLPFEQREVIILHLTGGLKFREIAKMLDTSTSTVQGRYRYGIAKLKTELNGENENGSR